ncbi:MAG TPA: GWxTD domain-containing protein [Candidatus Acidoferrales bacterium]|nr:GWxTD domain-containing protein [Candidatus Acidoferrales bacterium]
MKSIFRLREFAVCLSVFVFFLQSADAQKLRVNFDFATFRYDSTKTYAEVYYGFNGNALRFVRVVNKDSSRTFADSLLFDVSVCTTKPDSVASRQIWEVPVIIPDTTQEYIRKNLVGKIDFAVSPGNYRLIVKCDDLNDSLKGDSVATDFPVPDYNVDKLETSEIELCSTITQGKSSSIFYKNTYDVIPNPSIIFGLGMPIIYFYLEVYNIPTGKGDSLFTAGYEIRDSFGQVRKNSFRTRKKFGASSVEVGTVNGSNLKTGAYTFTYTVSDSAANLVASSSKKFFVYNPNLGAPEAPDSGVASKIILSSVYATMGEEQLDKEFGEAKYIASSSEKSQYGEITGLEGKRQFLYEFWKRKNSEENSNGKDERTEYLQRVAYADDHFRAGMREGWQTDRGRVYIMYGNPDEIDRHPNETDSKPYEIWYFNSVEGGVSFDFVDRTGFGDYQLVNSTERNEIHDDNWQQYLTQ